MTEVESLRDEIQALTAAVHEILGTRLSRTQVCDRLHICDKTLRTYVRTRGFPKDVAGSWRLVDVVEWEREVAAFKK